MIRRPPRSTQSRSSAASDVYKRQRKPQVAGSPTFAHYAAKYPLLTMGRPIFFPKNTPSHGPIHKPNHLPHPWPRPTYHPKRHTDPISRFATIHWTDRRRTTDNRPTDGWRECSVTKAAIRYASQPSNKSHGRRESDLIPVPTDVHRTAKGERGYNTPVTLV